MKGLRQKLLATFHVEHGEHVRRIRETLAIVERGATPAAAELDEAFRRAHSLKGAARAVDLRPIEQLAHRLETLLSRVREHVLALDKPVARVIHQALDASEDWLNASGRGESPAEPAQALDAIERVLGTAPAAAAAPAPASAAHPPAAARSASVEPESRPAPGAAPASSSGAPASSASEAPVVSPETVRLHANSLDRIVSSSGQLLTESLRQQQVTRQWRQIADHLSEVAGERDRARRSSPRTFQHVEATPELAPAARYLNYLEHQVQVLAREVGAARRQHARNAWALRALASALQQDVRQARMVPAADVFDGFGRMVRDLARDEAKSVELHGSGWQVEADRAVLQTLKDPVMHMLRNAISHGIEPAPERARHRKPADARVELSVEARGGELIVVVEDDGRGIDTVKVKETAIRRGLISDADAAARSSEELLRLVLLPGFSTAPAVSDLSGRGMGLSVVAEAVARLQGKVDIAPRAGGGTRIVLSVPLSLSSQRLLLVRCAGQTYALPVHGIERLHRVPLSGITSAGGRPIVEIDGQPLPVVTLAHMLEARESAVSADESSVWLMVIHAGTRRVAVAIDAFLSERDAIVKELPPIAAGSTAVAGGVLLEDGAVCLVLNPAELVERTRHTRDAFAVLASRSDAPAPQKTATILVVDDSMTTRTLEKSVLEAHGYDVAVAVDGMEALKHLRREPVGLVISDVQMPRLDGFGLLEEMKRDPRLSSIPVIIVSSLENPEDQARGLALGADAYIVKRRFEQRELLETIRQIL